MNSRKQMEEELRKNFNRTEYEERIKESIKRTQESLKSKYPKSNRSEGR